MIDLHIELRMTRSCFLMRYLLSSVGWGGSVAKEIAARVSITILIQSSWMTVKGLSPRVAPPKNMMNMAEMLTVI